MEFEFIRSVTRDFDGHFEKDISKNRFDPRLHLFLAMCQNRDPEEDVIEQIINYFDMVLIKCGGKKIWFKPRGNIIYFKGHKWSYIRTIEPLGCDELDRFDTLSKLDKVLVVKPVKNFYTCDLLLQFYYIDDYNTLHGENPLIGGSYILVISWFKKEFIFSLKESDFTRIKGFLGKDFMEKRTFYYKIDSYDAASKLVQGFIQ